MLALVVPVLVVYAKVWGYDFLVWDDNLYINENESIRGLAWANWKAFFTEFYVGNYQPLSILTYALEYALVGENGWLFHGTNVLLHAANNGLGLPGRSAMGPNGLAGSYVDGFLFWDPPDAR